MEILQFLQDNLPAYMLIALRANGLFLTAPLFGNARIPPIAKIITALAIAALVFPWVDLQKGHVPEDLFNYLLAGALELLTGLMYGWAATLIFEGMVLAGQFIGLQMGFAQANVLNPESETQRPLLSEIYFLLAMFIFFSINGHHFLVVGFQKSFTAVPIGNFIFNGIILERILFLFAQIFIVALTIAAPINGILTLMDLIMGLIARTAPQMNILILGFAVKIYVGMWLLIISLPFVFPYINNLLQELLEQVINLF